MQIDDVSVVYFRLTHLLGRARYVGDVYTEISEVRVTVCVIFCGVIVLYVG